MAGKGLPSVIMLVVRHTRAQRHGTRMIYTAGPDRAIYHVLGNFGWTKVWLDTTPSTARLCHDRPKCQGMTLDRISSTWATRTSPQV